MKIQVMMAMLRWLIRFMQENKPNEFEELKYKERRWRDFNRMRDIKDWIAIYGSTKSGARRRIEEILSELKLITYKDISNSNNLKQISLLALARLMEIVKKDEEMSRKDLEEKISGFIEASVQR